MNLLRLPEVGTADPAPIERTDFPPGVPTARPVTGSTHTAIAEGGHEVA